MMVDTTLTMKMMVIMMVDDDGDGDDGVGDDDHGDGDDDDDDDDDDDVDDDTAIDDTNSDGDDEVIKWRMETRRSSCSVVCSLKK